MTLSLHLHGDTEEHLQVIGDAAEIGTGHQIGAVSDEGAVDNSCILEA
jgi:hypothetical protein